MILSRYYSEISNRSTLLLLTWVSTVLVSYYYKETLLFIVIKPTLGSCDNVFFTYFIFTDVMEAFQVFIRIVLFLSNQVVILYFIYHFLIFISPGFYKNEHYFLTFSFNMVIFIFFLVILFFNTLLLPLSWEFFLSFHKFVWIKSVNLYFEAKLNEYLSFYEEFYFICMFYGQIAVLCFFFFFSTAGKDLKVFKKVRKFFYYFFVVASTLLTPPDVFSQFVVSFFFVLIYELLVLCLVIKSYFFKVRGFGNYLGSQLKLIRRPEVKSK